MTVNNAFHGVPAECQIMHRRRGWHRDMLSSETLYDIEKGFVKQQEVIAVVHISVIAAVSFLMPPHLFHHHSSYSLDVNLSRTTAQGRLQALPHPCQMFSGHTSMMFLQATSL